MTAPFDAMVDELIRAARYDEASITDARTRLLSAYREAAGEGEAVARLVVNQRRFRPPNTHISHTGIEMLEAGRNMPTGEYLLYTRPSADARDALIKAAMKVCWFDWSETDNDDDALRAIANLRAALDSAMGRK